MKQNISLHMLKTKITDGIGTRSCKIADMNNVIKQISVGEYTKLAK
jgi:hypothetical protein